MHVSTIQLNRSNLCLILKYGIAIIYDAISYDFYYSSEMQVWNFGSRSKLVMLQT